MSQLKMSQLKIPRLKIPRLKISRLVMRRLALSCLTLVACMNLFPSLATAQDNDKQTADHGAYLARAGDCTSCHTEPGHKLFAGGFKVNSPLGVIYGSNITPDPQFGIGDYSLNDFKRVLREGIAKDGHRLYPAMPYPDFAKMSDDDIAALYAYFMKSVTPVHEAAPETHLPFPFNQRWGMAFWDFFFARSGRFVPDPKKDPAWNRGAYLVEGPGHCGACHTPHGPAFEELGLSEKSPFFLTGSALDDWYAPDLRGDQASGLARWTEKDIADFLANGHGADGAAFGSMKEVVENSTQYMTPDDRAAIAHYIKSLAPAGEEASFDPDHANKNMFERPGAGIYATFCAGCHGANGAGHPPAIPALAGNPAVMASDPTSVIHIIMSGGATASTQKGMAPVKMPAFSPQLTDDQIAAVATYIRQSWGNNASSAPTRNVTTLKNDVKKNPE